MCFLFEYPITTVAPMDYREVLGLIIDFQTGQTRACHRITVNQDTVCEEPPEEFLSHLTYQSGVLPITVVRTPASIIINDSTELECSESRPHYTHITEYQNFGSAREMDGWIA